MKFDAVFFDLDGTLLDTAPDFFLTLNKILSERNKPTLQYDSFKQHVYGNSDVMVSYAFGIKKTHPDFQALRQEFITRYEAHCTEHTNYFPGMSLLLEKLDTKKIPWGIITNKPTNLTTLVLSHFNLDQRAAVIICGDTLSFKKPHPAPLLHACEKTHVKPNRAVYIGDLETDVQSARAAFMKSVIVAFGYHAPHAPIQKWGADFIANTTEDVMKWLG